MLVYAISRSNRTLRIFSENNGQSKKTMSAFCHLKKSPVTVNNEFERHFIIFAKETSRNVILLRRLIVVITAFKAHPSSALTTHPAWPTYMTRCWPAAADAPVPDPGTWPPAAGRRPGSPPARCSASAAPAGRGGWPAGTPDGRR